MKRLTFDGLFCDIAKCKETPGGTFCEKGSGSQRKVWERLKAYEDTKLEPEEVNRCKLTLMGKSLAEITEFDGVSIERLKELARADKEGRLVVLPCKVGDTVYAVQFATHEETEDGDLMPIAGGGEWVIWTVRVGIINYCDYRTKNTHGYVVGSTQNGSGVTFDFDDFGKTVFLTREEAEKELEGGTP